MNGTKFQPGQRVFAPAEPHLGLGLIIDRQNRRFEVLFAKGDEQRTYSLATETLVRFQACPGDIITDSKGTEHKVSEVIETDHVLSYLTEEGVTVPEVMLGLEFARPDPFSELVVGRPGSPSDFDRRFRAHRLRALGRAQSQRGLGAARVELLPHQLFVAERVSKMWRPRVLLADEVGLGKTIEAGLITVRLAALGRIQSVAVVAPRALVGQWLAEFYRRFARPLTMFDPEVTDLAQDLLIAADDLDFLPADFSRDLLIVDEAHHYAEDQVLRLLTERSRAVLLLSATPSLGGQSSLFELLHLLDPLRYPDSSALESVGHHWSEVSELARLLEDENLKESSAKIEKLFGADSDLSALIGKKQFSEVLERLVDRHGLGRSLIRNRRRRLQNLFQGREVRETQLGKKEKVEDYLITLLRSLTEAGEKALVMVETPQQVAKWAKLLAKKTTLCVARFDETMSLLERDRQAAWFNATENDAVEGEAASVLICSEIGGEGRNFQVAHNLVLLDLPAHPDRLEQRIGRLDRIGQTQTVIVHVPIPEKAPEIQVRFAWLHHGLDAFRRPLTQGQNVFAEFKDQLEKWENTGPSSKFETWCKKVRKTADTFQENAQASIDPLVDRMSFDEERAFALRDRVEDEQDEMAGELSSELSSLLDSLGVNMDPRGKKGMHYIRPSGQMFVEAIPGLPPRGCKVTTKRALANRRDEVEFLHFEHRLVQGTLDVILDEGVGKATAARWKKAPTTTVLFQFLFCLEAEGPTYLGLDRFLPAQSVLCSGDLSGEIKIGGTLLDGTAIEESKLERLPRDVVQTLITRTAELRPQLLSSALGTLAGSTEKLVESAKVKAKAYFTTERERLEHLRQTDESEDVLAQLYTDSIAELDRYERQATDSLEGLDWRFDAVRMILCQA